MSLPIIFAPSAQISLIRITEFIKEKWGKNSSDKFKMQVDRTLKSISQQPRLFKASGAITASPKRDYQQANFILLSTS